MPEVGMSSYRLQITRLDENPEYEKQAEKYSREVGYRPPMLVGTIDHGAPQRNIETRTLDVILTDEEWLAIKQALLGLWK